MTHIAAQPRRTCAARRRHPRARIALTLPLALLAGGCGHTARRLPAAEPGHDSKLSATPVGRSVRVGADPQGIAVDPQAGVVAVGVHNPSRIVLLSARTGRVLRAVDIAAAPRHVEFVAPDGPFLVPEERADQLLELRIDPQSVRSFKVGTFPHAAAGTDGRVFVGDERGGALTEILPSGRTRTIGGFRQPGGVAVAGDDLAVVDVGAFTLTLLDPRTDKRIGRLAAGRGPTHAVADPRDIYVVDTRGDAILTFSISPFRQIGRTSLAGSPYGVAIDPIHGRLWVTETGLNRVAELSITGRLPRLVRTLPTGLQPDTVAVDSGTGRVFVANQVAGDVQIIDP